MTVQELVDLLKGDAEFALFDVREEGIYAQGHLLFAVPLPLSRLESRIGVLVPRLKTTIVLVGDDHLTLRASQRLKALGYEHAHILEGGMRAWAAAGYEIISGVNVPSKLFGEYVEAEYQTPSLAPAELDALRRSGKPVLVVDSRPSDEFHTVSIPGAVNCPGVELLYRLPALINDPQTTVVVNCAGRTRSIIGCQSLINAGFPYPVHALRNGTIGWHLAGFPVDNGKRNLAPEPSEHDSERAQEVGHALTEQYGLSVLSRPGLEALIQNDNITTYVLDVRSPEEFVRGHLPGAVNAPGGQLVQATDEFVGTRNATLVLCDTEGVRAAITASWLLQQGWSNVWIYQAAHEDLTESGPRKSARFQPDPAGATAISVEELASLRQRPDCCVVDVSSSLSFRQGHMPGAHFAIRSRLVDDLARLPEHTILVLTSEDGDQAWWASRDVNEQKGAREIRVLQGGNAAWTAQGLELEAGMEPALHPPEDMWYRPTSPYGGGESAMKQYIAWELGLYEKLLHEPGVKFKLPHDLQAAHRP